MAGHRKIEAAHYRTWQFLEPLLDDGHEVHLCADDGDGIRVPDERRYRRVAFHPISFRRRLGWARTLQRVHDEIDPDCVLTVNFDSALCATKLRTEKPIWMDIYGDYFTIVQAACHRRGSDRGIATSVRFGRRVLETGDVFSVCSVPQQHALVGELAMLGRLNARNFGYSFARVVRPGTAPCDETRRRRTGRSTLAAFGIPDGAFAVLWCGGYNTWTDVETLFAGLESAMAGAANVHFVSVGASSYEGPRTVYEQFSALVSASSHRERYHLLGWRPWNEMDVYYRECDVGLNIDALHYETVYGTRTRIVEMIGAGLPVITTLGCELSNLLADEEAALTFEIGDSETLGNAIVALAAGPQEGERIAERALRYAREELSFATTTACLREWIRAPMREPGSVDPSWRERLRRVEYAGRSIVRQALWRVAGLDR